MKTVNLWKLYQRFLTKHPVVSQSIQTSLLMGAGDILSQTVIEKHSFSEINVIRTTRFASIGLLLGGPVLRNWYGFLHNYVGNSGAIAAVQKVLLDQLIMAPLLLAVLLISLSILQGKTMDESIIDLKRNYRDVLLNNYKIWPWVQLANFYVVPLNYQVLLVQVVALFWNTYISWKTNLHHPKKTI